MSAPNDLENLIQEIFAINQVEKPRGEMDFCSPFSKIGLYGSKLCFDDRAYDKEKFANVFELLNIYGHDTEYAIRAERADVGNKGFITQLQFHAPLNKDLPYIRRQPHNLIDAMDMFIQHEKSHFGREKQITDYFENNISAISGKTNFIANNLEDNEGTLGIGFCFLVEDFRSCIYRIWSFVIYYGK